MYNKFPSLILHLLSTEQIMHFLSLQNNTVLLSSCNKYCALRFGLHLVQNKCCIVTFVTLPIHKTITASLHLLCTYVWKINTVSLYLFHSYTTQQILHHCINCASMSKEHIWCRYICHPPMSKEHIQHRYSRYAPTTKEQTL